MDTIINILILSTAAGLATGLGGIIALVKKPGKKLLGFFMGLAAGVMITLAFLELIPRIWETSGFLVVTIGFTMGAIFMFFLDFLFPHLHFGVKEKGIISPKLFKTGMLIAIGVFLHNIPEGIAVGAAFLHLPKFGIFIAIAIALHNIPEGIAIVSPLYASGSRKLTAFLASLFSGFAEPIGAIGAAFFLTSFPALVLPTFAFAAGVMIFIVLDELIPIAHKEAHEHSTSIGVIIGVILVFLLMGILSA